MTHNQKRRTIWTLAVTSVALFMVSLDNLVVTTALPVIRHQLHASISQLEWTVNAYTLTFAVLLLTGAALGDRFGRRRLFVAGLLLFTGASAFAALATSATMLDAARAAQGVGGAIVAPLTLTILSAGVPAERRGLALGIWGGVGGLAVALGPLVGGAVVDGVSWHWIFWLNVPIGLALAPLAWRRLDESRGDDSGLDLRGLALASAGLLGIVWGLVRGNAHGWTSAGIVAPLVAGALLVAAFVAWERRAPAPMLPLRFFRGRTFTLANVASLLMFFGMFGSIFLLAQFFQTVQGLSPLAAGLRILPWTAMPMFVAPVAGALSDRIGGERLMTAGLALQGAGLLWIAAVTSPGTPYAELVGPFMLSGAGMALFFAPVANVVLGAVRPQEQGKASGATNAIRELGGVFGVAALASVFAHLGGYRSAQSFVHGTTTAVYVGGGVVLAAAVAAALIPRTVRRAEAPAAEAALAEAA
ncbi:MAG TPA: DHA2 family efflux MFS transporter permease subunit [Gaiellaceae bacterium]|nr:DHA2 family efflux MFS transporter permease subunit [Gaiellaceae bacterium]